MRMPCLGWVVCEQSSLPNDRSLSKAGAALPAQGIGDTD